MCQDLGMESRGQRPCLDRRLSCGHRHVGWGQAGDPSQRPGGTSPWQASSCPPHVQAGPRAHTEAGGQAARASLAGGLQSSVRYTRNPLSSRNFWNPSQKDNPYHTIANQRVSE